jgi:aminomethyltransferase
LLEAGKPFGMLPAGLGALRSVRIEKRYPLYGLDLDETTSPIEAGVGWTVRFDKGEFIGRDALLRQKEHGVSRKLTMIAFPDLSFTAATGDAITVDGQAAGTISSGDRGFFLKRSLAMGYIPPSLAVPGAKVTVTAKAGGASGEGEILAKAPYDPEMTRVRS